MKKQYLAYYAAPALFILMLVDTQLTRIFNNVTENVYLANAHLFLIALMVCCQVLPKRYMLITGLILGLLFDSYYISVIGIYAVTIPAIIWLMYLLCFHHVLWDRHLGDSLRSFAISDSSVIQSHHGANQLFRQSFLRTDTFD